MVKDRYIIKVLDVFERCKSLDSIDGKAAACRLFFNRLLLVELSQGESLVLIDRLKRKPVIIAKMYNNKRVTYYAL